MNEPITYFKLSTTTKTHPFPTVICKRYEKSINYLYNISSQLDTALCLVSDIN